MVYASAAPPAMGAAVPAAPIGTTSSGVSGPQPPAHERVAPDARRALGREALVQRLRAARVVRDGDEQFDARRGRGQEFQLREERRAPLVVVRRHERIDQQQRLAGDQRVRLDLFGPRPPLRVRRRPAVDARGQLVHLVLLGAPSSYRCLVLSAAAAIPAPSVEPGGVASEGSRRASPAAGERLAEGLARRSGGGGAPSAPPPRPHPVSRRFTRSRPSRSLRCGCARTVPGRARRSCRRRCCPSWLRERWS